MINTYKYNAEDNVLEVTQAESKSLEDIKRVMSANKPIAVVDKFIELYLLTLDSEQEAADKWYEQYLLVENSDPTEQREIVTETDSDGGEQSRTLPNAYEVALAARHELEASHAWLKSLRGIEAQERPVFVADVEQWKLDNKSLMSSYLKRQGVKINDVFVSLTESQQNGIAAIKQGLDLAEKHGRTILPINFNAETPTGNQWIKFDTIDEFEMFALQFMAARQVFY
ncbi:hypothetical protein [Thalassotalea euphylliae]|uniref:Uncharacterized protein n=1 Tax=Thalassotalea euphylliae TaxID=1655234 RepID=A0A3E0U7L6_9GAMM|nr:hypothetical protein [Thalassotalea euphylliae]REL32533.1 hypothetical protein DXX94_18455 [Thalassotalea euphylliae]